MSRTSRVSVGLALSLAAAAFTGACSDVPTDPMRAPAARGQPDQAVTPTSRTPLQEGIVHYTYDLELGPGPYDVVELHRIVRERRPNRPARTVDGVFLLPGAPNSWTQIFVEPLVSDVSPWDQSVAIHLARNGLDVWGIDYAWARVPMGTEDFGFFQGWGIGKDIEFAHEALAAARSIRTSTGQGNGRLHLLGFSYGGPVAYGVAARETQLPPGRRMVKGLIAVDTEVKLEEPERRAVACENADDFEEQIAEGTYVNSSAAGLLGLAGLAVSAPDDPSPVAPPGLELTNREFILFATASGVPHFVGGTFDEAGVPTGLRFTDPDLWVDVILATRPYWPLGATADVARSRCESGRDVAFDDNLREITVPILYVGAAGGTGLAGAYTASLTSTGDYEEVLVRLLPDEERAHDFGHADLFTASNAATHVWEPIREWIVDHRENRTHPGRPGDEMR